MERFKERTHIIIGDRGVDILEKSSVLVFGVGGVGSFVVEGLVRAGIGNITIVDFDEIDETNINRQIPALHSTVGLNKVDVMEKRMLDINPNLNIIKKKMFYNEENSNELLKGEYDFVVDAIDSMKQKIHLLETASKAGYNVISSMGMGNKLDPSMIKIDDIYKTQMCPLARVVRREMKNRGVKKLTVVYSTEPPCKTATHFEEGRMKRINGSISFVPSVAGLTIASYVVRKLLGEK